MALTARAPAKINLFLHVGAPGANGRHPICSLMAFADIGDELAVHDSETPLTLRVQGPFAGGLSAGDDNLVLRAARALMAHARAPMPAIGLTLAKRLPVASGLGGGSSDAGAALRLLREALAIDVDDDGLEAIAATLGADGAACLWGRPTLATGEGAQLSPAPGLPTLDVVLVNAGAPVSTAAVYGRFDTLGRFGDVGLPAMPTAFEDARELAAWLGRATRNDLRTAAVEVEPQIGAVLATLADEPETLLARVSGSGGTCFAICADDMDAEGLAERVSALAPDWWVQRCRLNFPPL